MASPRLFDYVKAAFTFGPVVPGLGRVPVNALAVLAVGVAGVVFSPGILLIGAAAELSYLTFASSDRRFRRLVESRFSSGDAEANDTRRAQMRALVDREDQERHSQLEDRCREVARLQPQSAGALSTNHLQALSRLSWIFLKLLVSRRMIREKVREDGRADIEAKLADTEARLASPEAGDATSPLRRTLESTAELLRRRLENVKKGYERAAYCDGELDRIEQQVALLVEDAALAKDSDGLGYRVDAVAATLDESQAYMFDSSTSLDGVDLETPPDITLARDEVAS